MRGNADLPYRWNPSYPARVGVMPRDGGNADVRWFDVEPCYVFHPLNAYDDGDSIVLDVVRHPKMFDTRPARAQRGPAHAGSLDRRPRRRQGPRDAARRPAAGVPAGRRAAGRATAPLRLRDADVEHRGRRRRLVLKHDLRRGHTARAAARRASVRRRVRLRAQLTAGARGRRGADGVRLRRQHRPQRPGDPRRREPGDRSPRSTCRSGCPYGFHGNWVPTPTT